MRFGQNPTKAHINISWPSHISSSEPNLIWSSWILPSFWGAMQPLTYWWSLSTQEVIWNYLLSPGGHMKPTSTCLHCPSTIPWLINGHFNEAMTRQARDLSNIKCGSCLTTIVTDVLIWFGATWHDMCNVHIVMWSVWARCDCPPTNQPIYLSMETVTWNRQ